MQLPKRRQYKLWENHRVGFHLGKKLKTISKYNLNHPSMAILNLPQKKGIQFLENRLQVQRIMEQQILVKTSTTVLQQSMRMDKTPQEEEHQPPILMVLKVHLVMQTNRWTHKTVLMQLN